MELKDHNRSRGDLQRKRNKIHWGQEEQQQCASQLPHHSHCPFAQINHPGVNSPNYSCHARCDKTKSSHYISRCACTLHGNQTWLRTSQQPATNPETSNSSPKSLDNMKCFVHKESQLLDEELNRKKELARSSKPYSFSDAITNHKGMTEKDMQENRCPSSIPQSKGSARTQMFLEGCFKPDSYDDHNFPFRTKNLNCIHSANVSQEDGMDKCDQLNEQESMAKSNIKMPDVKIINRKSSNRQRNKSLTKDTSLNTYNKEDMKEHPKKNSKSSSNKQRHSKSERKRQHAENRNKLKFGLLKQMEKLLWRCARSWLLKQAKLGSEQLRRFCLSLMKMTLKFLKMLLALLFLALMLFIGCVQLGYKYAKSGLFMIFQRLPTWDQESFPHLVMICFLHCLFSSREESRNYLKRLWEKLQMKFWLIAKLQTVGRSASSSPQSPGAHRYQPDNVIDQLLAMADVPKEELDPFKVLGVEVIASDAELKKAYRRLAVLVHPDKNQHPRSEEAFKVVRAAWDIVSNPERRKEYEIKCAAESELHRSMNEFLTKLQEDLKEAMNIMLCSKCEGKHKRFEMDRDPRAARYCAKCNKRHAVEDGDFWAESKMLGLKITYFAMMDGKVYDITEWAGCQKVRISPDKHHVHCHISFATRTCGAGGQHRAGFENGPSSPADIQEFLSKIFWGAAPESNMSSFYPSQTGSNGQAKEEPTQRTDSKQKRRKKVRRTFPH
ncbi:dnaJ homolog subfamily C member 14 [Narcine bancroftii]|uniref:dnaJ homolog subfamily C member 14 n=1 Tax=Narcine bancroftii TaxID=1343680 RepID=UPI003831A5AF